jgi:hypothetical protein
MEQPEMERLVKNIDARLARVEQFLPSVATKDDLKAYPTRVELEARLATLATKDDLKAFATKEELRDEGERTRRHFDIAAERMRDDVKLSLEGHQRLTERVDDLERTTGALNRRVRLFEAGPVRRKK